MRTQLKSNRIKIRHRIRTLKFLLAFYLHSDRAKNTVITESAKDMIQGLEEVELVFNQIKMYEKDAV